MANQEPITALHTGSIPVRCPMQLHDLLSRLSKVADHGTYWKAVCPAHKDKSPSLTVAQGERGIVMKCHAGCRVENILSKLGLSWDDLFSNSSPAGAGDGPVSYRRALAKWTLSREHKTSLSSRGLSPEWIAAAGYGTISDAVVLDEDDKTPGFEKGRPIITEGLAIPVRSLSGEVVSIQVRTSGTPKYKWLSSPENKARIACHVPIGTPETVSTLRLTEGPLKADVATFLSGVTTLGVPGVTQWHLALPIISASQTSEVIIAFDADWQTNAAVRRALRACLAAVSQIVSSVLVETWPLSSGKGIDDVWKNGRQDTIVLGSVRETMERLNRLDADNTEGRLLPITMAASRIDPRPVEWLWPGWLAAGSLAILDGDPGKGKSTILADLAARVTTGAPFPGVNVGREPGNVVILAAEDAADTVLVPRFLACEGDPARYQIVRGVLDNGQMTGIRFPRHMDVIEGVLVQHRPKLLVIDPIMAFLEDVDTSVDAEVRSKVMARLSGLAEVHNTCILLVRHLNKSGANKALYRGLGSVGFVGAARTSCVVGNCPDSGRTVLACVKSNLGRFPTSLFYEIETHGDHSRVSWQGPADVTADELVSTPTAVRKTASSPVDRCVTWIRHNGFQTVDAARKVASKAGFTAQQITDAWEKL